MIRVGQEKVSLRNIRKFLTKIIKFQKYDHREIRINLEWRIEKFNMVLQNTRLVLKNSNEPPFDNHC